MSASYASQDGRSRLNITTTPLEGGETFTGQWETNNREHVMVSCITDQDGRLYVELSNDDARVISPEPNGYFITAGEHKQVIIVKGAKSVRVRFENTSSSTQTYLEIYTYYGESFVTEGTGQTVNDFQNTTPALTTFGETATVTNTAYIQATALYDLIPANFREFSASGGTTGAENRLFKCSTGTSVGGYAAVQSFRAGNARAGQALMSRFSGYFTQGIANSWQGIGLISIGDELSFGYNGVDFGVWHRYGGLAETREVTVTSGAGGSEDLTLTLNGVDYTIPITSGTVQHNAYEIADWLNQNQGIWNADQLDDTVIINALSDGAKSGVYSFSSSSATGTITQVNAGVLKTSDFVVQSEWNGHVPNNFDPTKGNVFQIDFQNMGYGEISYKIEDPETASIRTVHTIKVGSLQTYTQLGNPSLRAGMYCVSLGSTTNIDVYADSFSSFIQGKIRKTRNPRAISNTAAVTTTNETALLTLRNRKTYNGYTNQVEIDPLLASVSNETSRNATVRVRATTRTGIEQNFQTAGNNLVGDVDTTGINFTGGRLIAAKSLPPGGSVEIDLKDIEVSQPPSLMLIITVERAATGGSNNNFTATQTWYEDL